MGVRVRTLDFSCEMSKRLLSVPSSLFISQNFVCLKARLFTFKTKIKMNLMEIKAIQNVKENPMMVLIRTDQKTIKVGFVIIIDLIQIVSGPSLISFLFSSNSEQKARRRLVTKH